MRPIAYFFSLLLCVCLSSCGDDDEASCSLENTSYTFNVPENSANGTLVGQAGISAGDGSEITYSILSGNELNLFSVNPDTGEITVSNSGSLDYENVQQVSLGLGVSSATCGTAELQVTVMIGNQPDQLYTDQLFSSVNETKDLVYGDYPEFQNMTVYTPVTDGDMPPRPLLIIAGGGAFYPSALGFLAPIGRRMAKAGYVVAAIRYLSDPDDELDPQVRLIHAAQDLKAAVRFFRKSAGEGNPFGIDPDNIFMGGFGTGAFLLYPAYYVKENDVTPEEWVLINENGGLEGNRGTPGYSSEVKALVSLSGGIYDINWIDSGELPVVCIHAENDPEVPCGAGGNFQGSCNIIERAQQQNIDSKLILIPGSNHDAPANCTNCYDQVMQFLYPYIE